MPPMKREDPESSQGRAKQLTVEFIQSICLHIALIGLTGLVLFPLLWMVSVSLMSMDEAGHFPPPLLPESASLLHYRVLFEQMDVGLYAWNSTLIAGLVSLYSVLFNSMAGYAFAKLHFPGKDRLFSALLSLMVIPSQAAMLPLFLILKEMNLVNTYAGIIIPGMVSIFGIFMVRQYALTIPDSLLDAARIDGASEFRIYWSLVLPVCRPVLVTLAIFSFMGSWNDFMWPLIVLSGGGRYTLPVGLANLMGEHVQDVELMMGGAVLTVLPVIVLFFLLQRHYMAGLVSGGLKG